MINNGLPPQFNPETLFGVNLRFVEDADSEAVIQLLDSIYAEYDVRLDLPDLDADLIQVATYYRKHNAWFWVLEDAEKKIVGTVCVDAVDQTKCMLKRLYLSSVYRGKGIGMWLLEHAMEWARRHSFTVVELWSDTRFLAAHELYRRANFIPPLRDKNHPSVV
jgi:putative acetyltransferase